MPHTDTRSVRETYWYTTAQIDDLGEKWAEEGDNRTFLCPHTANRTALTTEAVERLGRPPQQILLPLNKGNNHWTTVTVNIVRKGDKHDVQISFMDSLNGSKLSQQSATVRAEIKRIEKLFRDNYESCKVSSSTYRHAWQQADGSSCGPYSIANGIRCLAGDGAPDNPGRKAIREWQLDKMTNGTAIRSCSTNNTLDNILMDWVFHHIAEGGSVEVRTEEDVLGICTYYAEAHGKDLAETIKTFHDEYLAGNQNPYFRPVPVNLRIRELVGQHGLSPKGPSHKKGVTKGDYSDLPLEDILKLIDESLPKPPKAKTKPKPSKAKTKPKKTVPVDYSKLSTDELWEIIKAQEAQKATLTPVIQSIKKENAAQNIDKIRTHLETTGIDTDVTFKIMQNIVQAIQQERFNEAIGLVDEAFPEQEKTRHACYQIISDVMGAKSILPSYDSKLISLSHAYGGLSYSYKITKGQQLGSLVDTLDAQVILLESAIDRSQAGPLRQVGYLIQDFCSCLINGFSGKGFESSFSKRISVVNQMLYQTRDPEGKVDYQSVVWAIKTLKESPEKVSDELQKRVDEQQSTGEASHYSGP